MNIFVKIYAGIVLGATLAGLFIILSLACAVLAREVQAAEVVLPRRVQVCEQWGSQLYDRATGKPCKPIKRCTSPVSCTAK